ncbi:hypothetical protein A2954_03845 [Candidatus Roizmanbacteria bacterium RIFCSPLOWO2_01_FULL_37_12]|uniref:Uncharacterized protein n=1 Tax=Candidatus Roizmanbacteria bacterium RIFCSPLOWO2_01_FULL_37_12 TaxID=1802056 RepID=A0A1F7IEM2_9BACT|nr:MAG: hypothetical protein A3D76_02750 [Candidatus Roizmanbacteria bacterium RIFCSPHIGHO2_02_FULL_37_9b]OGK41819.1 MAG: hypothetical protein A2954_03845 [Candidatus Roizmanbacteria bacterium RIFCSPLOWO2_01_FULL_37_12]
MELFKAYIESETQLSWGNGIYNLGRLALAGLSIYHLNQGENNLALGELTIIGISVFARMGVFAYEYYFINKKNLKK